MQVLRDRETARDERVGAFDVRRPARASVLRLHEQGVGAELEVVARRDGWLRVLAGGEYEGWLPEASAVTW